MTRWSPDTCSCVLEFDDDFGHTASIVACSKHDHLAGQQHLDAVAAHNRKKNAVLNETTDHIKQIGGDASTLVVAYDENDDLHVSGSGLSAQDQRVITNKLARLGPAAFKFKS